jgi:hypothetical protein
MEKQVAYLQRLFYDLWNDFGSVFLVVRYSPRSIIGKRGFTDDEKKQGLILVFNNRTNTRLDWDADGNLSCVLAFGTSKEEVFIHCDDLMGVFSPDAGVQFLRVDTKKTAPAERDAEQKEKQVETPDAGQDEKPHVVSMSGFKKRKKSPS